MSEKAREGRIRKVAEAEAEKLGRHSVCIVYDAPAGEFRPHPSLTGKA